MNNNIQGILNKRLFKATARNDIKEIRRLINIGADIDSEFTIDQLINNKLIDNNAITTIRNAETTFDKLAKFLRMDPNTINIIKNMTSSKVIYIPISINKIILSPNSKLSSLQLAIMNGCWKEVIIELIKKGANPNKALDIQGITVLQLMCTAAVFKDRKCFMFDEEIIQLLFDYGADPNIQDKMGKSFLNYAVISSDFHISEIIAQKLSKTKCPDIPEHRDIKRIESFLMNGSNPNIKDKYNQCTILFYIEQHDSYLHEVPKLHELLLDHGCIYSTHEDVVKHPDFVKLLQDSEIFTAAMATNVVDSFNSEHKPHVEQNSLLMKAIKGGMKDKVSLLLNKATSPNIRDKDGLSALHHAVKLGDYAITEILLKKGADPNIKSWKNGTTPLFNAVTNNMMNIAELLLMNKANPSVINTKGFSPLYFSITMNNEGMTELLLKYKANPDISRQISVLFDFINGVKKDSDIKIIENTFQKIRHVIGFLKSKEISIDYKLFYQSIDIAEENNKKNIAKKVMELLDELF